MSARARRARRTGSVTRASAVALLSGLLASVFAGEPVPVTVRTAPGRFEIAAIDSAVAHVLAATAEDAWRHLAAPLSLPEAFPTPVFVRLIPDAPGEGPITPRLTVESGGIVSLRLAASSVGRLESRRALVQALLLRLTVAYHGASRPWEVPLWLEQACEGWWETRADAAQLDAWKYESSRITIPPLAEVVSARRGERESRAHVVAALWVFSFLQTESDRGREWTAALPRLLAGDDPLATIAAGYPGRFRDATERELWWQTGCQHLCRARSLPTLEAADSRRQLEALARFVFTGASGESDVVVPLVEVMARTAEPIVAAEIARRRAELNRLIPALHPFYRNAGLALAEAFSPPRGANAPRQSALCAAFEQDWHAAMELEAASTAALDALEKR